MKRLFRHMVLIVVFSEIRNNEHNVRDHTHSPEQCDIARLGPPCLPNLELCKALNVCVCAQQRAFSLQYIFLQ